MKKPKLPEGGYDLIDTRKDKLPKVSKDLTGIKIGNFEITSFSCNKNKYLSNIDSIIRLWYVKCLCGNTLWATSRNLLSGITCSCGCKIKSRIGTINPLFDDSPVSRYWIGFLLADGHFSKKGIKVCLSIKDVNHIIKLAQFLNCNVSKYNERCQIGVEDKHRIEILKDKYNIKTRKTYNPPDFSKLNLTDEERYDIAIGYIDGDGHIQKRNNAIVIKNHINWKPVHEWFQTFLIPNSCLVKTTSENKSLIYIGVDNFIILRKVIDKFNLPVMKRKWNGRKFGS